jgi:hypothetical protein
MSNDLTNENHWKSSREDARSFAIAHGIFELLKRAFYSVLPFLLLWGCADWPVSSAFLGAIVAGYGLEALWVRFLAEDRHD